MSVKVSDAELYYLGEKMMELGKKGLIERLYKLVKGIREIQSSMSDDQSNADIDDLVEHILACKEVPEYGRRAGGSNANVTCYIDHDHVVTWHPKTRVFLYSKRENGKNEHRLIAGRKAE